MDSNGYIYLSLVVDISILRYLRCVCHPSHAMMPWESWATWCHRNENSWGYNQQKLEFTVTNE